MSNQTSPTVKHPTNCPPCPDALRWSTNYPNIPGFYFMRTPNPSRNGWVTAVVEVKAPQPGSLLAVYGAYPLIGVTVNAAMTMYPSAQWSDRAVAEPTGG